MAETDGISANARMDLAEFRALLDAAVDAIVVIDGGGLITTFNAAAERMFGYRACEAIGKPVQQLMPEPHRSMHQGYIRRYLETGEARIIGIGREVLGQRANGEVFPIALSVGEARDERGSRFVGIIRDLSNERQEEQRARGLEARLAHVGRFNLMGEMAAGIAHEINQPLSAIATYAQAASRILERDQPGMTKLIEVCRKIDEQARRAGAVIDNLRKFIRQRKVDTQALDVNRTIVDVINLMEADATAEGIAIATELTPDLPRVSADAVQLQQVLLNLTRNAVDAIRSGVRREPGISIATRRTARGGVRIEVADCGPGVARHLAGDIFHPFVTTKPDGLGVGLAISRTIVQSYGGKLTYRDNPMGGATFEVDLPPIEPALA